MWKKKSDLKYFTTVLYLTLKKEQFEIKQYMKKLQTLLKKF